jgi:hypothetical protein
MLKGYLTWAFAIPAVVLLIGAYLNRHGERTIVTVFGGGSRWSLLLLWSSWRAWLGRRFRRQPKDRIRR